ncbi:uncharacterized protein ACIB01_013456 isoform 2-T2 [Guaruba guarouba]
MCLATRASSVARGCLRAAGNGSGPAAPSHILPHVCGRSRGRAGAERVPCGSCPRWGSPWGSGCFTLDPSPHPEAAALTPVGASGLVQWLWGTQDRSPSDLAELKHQLSPILALCPGSAGSLHPTDPPVPQRPTCTPRSPQVALKDWDICDPLLPGQVGPREPRPVPPPTLPIPDGAIPRCPPRCSSAGC